MIRGRLVGADGKVLGVYVDHETWSATSKDRRRVAFVVLAEGIPEPTEDPEIRPHNPC